MSEESVKGNQILSTSALFSLNTQHKLRNDFSSVYAPAVKRSTNHYSK